MSELTSINPSADWCYSVMEIPKLAEIVTELSALDRNTQIRRRAHVMEYYNVEANDALALCPALKEYLTNMGLKGRIDRIMLSLTWRVGSQGGVHIDSISKDTHCAINIPVSHGEGSYTAWHQAASENAKGIKRPNGLTTLALNDDYKVSEIARLQTESGAALVNVARWHMGHAGRLGRKLCSIRIRPGDFLTGADARKMGIANPFIQS